MYLVFALVWIWDRVRVQRWTLEHGSSPVPSAYSFPSGWGETGSLTKTGFPVSLERIVQEQKYLWLTNNAKKLVVVEVFGKDNIIGKCRRDSTFRT